MQGFGEMYLHRPERLAARLIAVVALATGLCLAHPHTSVSARAPLGPRYKLPQPARWTLTGPMAHVRVLLTLTRLVNGKVLAVGGQVSPNASTGEASAELYDPRTGRWNPTGSLPQGRYGHTATLLRDGHVLIVGGGGAGFEPYASATLYDPRTGRWSPTGSLRHARDFPTATLLVDGRVLIAGAAADANPSGAEVYDPRTGRWTLIGPMRATRLLPNGYADSRREHTATALRDGRVLLAGGNVGTNVVASAEIFDPRTGRWLPTASMRQKRADAGAALLPDGRVLVAGGDGGGGAIIPSAEIYDPRVGRWSVTGSMHDARSSFRLMVLPDGKALAVGGGGAAFGRDLATAELYDPRSGTWSRTASMHHDRTQFDAALLASGQVLVAGGNTGLAGPEPDRNWANAEVYSMGASG